MLKIICLIGKGKHLNYFVNKLNESHPVAIAIIEKPLANELNSSRLKSLIKSGIISSKENTEYPLIKFARLFKSSKKKEKDKRVIEIYNKSFGSLWNKLNDNIKRIYVEDINSTEVQNLLAMEKADLILCHGTKIVKDFIFNQSKLALNLHWGLSPYYRGSRCSQWAIINWDVLNIGVTVHKLSSKIDGGDILGQKRTQIVYDDTIQSINFKLTLSGTEIIIDAINKLNNGSELIFHKQELSLGIETKERQWSQNLTNHLNYIFQNNLLKAMIEKPSRKQLPIIELV